MHWSVVGHADQKKVFEKLVSEGAFARAYLFSGPSGVGKKMFAFDIAGALLGSEKSPDLLVLQPGVSKETGKPTDISVKEAQDMKAWAYQRPLYGTAKVVVIDDADRLGAEAANALLKVLEEPPAYLYVFLVTSVRGAVLPTILSRCHEVVFGALGASDMERALVDVSLSPDDRQLLQAIARGRPGSARAYLTDGRLSEVSRAIDQLKRLCAGGVAERLVLTKALADEDALPEIVLWWLAWVHTALTTNPSLAPLARGLLELASATSESKYNHRLALDRFALELPAISW